MGLCLDCSPRGSYESDINNFFSKMKIRKTDPKELINLVQETTNPNPTDKTIESLYDKLLSLNLKDQIVEHYRNIFDKAYKDLGKKDLSYFTISLLFLCKKNKKECYRQIKEIYTTKQNLKDLALEDNGELWLNRQELKDILTNYTTLVSSMSLEFVGLMFNKKIEHKRHLEDIYSDIVIGKFIEDVLSRITEEGNPMVSLDKFFDRLYKLFACDDDVREGLFLIYKKDY